MSTPQGRFVWYELMTTDTAAAKYFYREVIGWSTQDMPMPGMTYTILAAGEAQVGGLMAIPAEAAGMKPCWSAYICVDDVDAAAGKVKRLGGTVCRAPDDIPNVGRFAVVADPQGAMFNLFKSSNPGQTAASMEPGRFGWSELHSTDWPKAFEFYREMFGWEKGEAIDMGETGTYQLFTIGGQGAGGMFNSPAAQQARFWLFYTRVGDIDAAVGRIERAGGKVMHGPQQVPGGIWIVQATDPQGALFALLGTRK